MKTTLLKKVVLNELINDPNDDLLMEELKGYIFNKAYEEDERKELGDEEEDDDDDERRELGDDEEYEEDEEEFEEMDDNEDD